MSRNTSKSHERDDLLYKKSGDQTGLRRRKEQKKPDLAIYRSGQSRLSRRTSPGTSSDVSEGSSSGTEISPTKTVQSVIVERSSVYSQANKGAVKTHSPKSSVNIEHKNAISCNERTNKSSFNRQSQQRSSGKGRRHESISYSEEVLTKPPVTPGKQIHREKDTIVVGSTQNERRRDQVGMHKNSRGDQLNKAAQPKKQEHGIKDTVAKTSTQDVRCRKEQEEPKSSRHSDTQATHLQKQVHRVKDSIAIDPIQDTRQQEQPETSSWKEEQSEKYTHASAHKKQLKVVIEKDVKEPAEISPTTIELISSWKGNQINVNAANKSSTDILQNTKEESLSISKGKGPLRTETNACELSSNEAQMPQTQNNQVQTRDEGKEAPKSEISKVEATDKPKKELVHPQKNQPSEYMGGPGDENAAEWDWVKELMSKEPPSQPKYYHGKSKEDSPCTGAAITQASGHTGNDNKDRSLMQEVTGSHEAKIDVSSEKNQHGHKQDKLKTSRNEKQGIAGGGKDKGGGGWKERGQQDEKQQKEEWGADLMEVKESNTPQKIAVADNESSQSDHESKKHSNYIVQGSNRMTHISEKSFNRRQPLERDVAKTASRFNRSKETDHQHDPSHSKRPERAIYKTPRRVDKPDQRSELSYDRHHKEDRKRQDERGRKHSDDYYLQEDHELVSREVEVSPNKQDLTITVKNDNLQETKHEVEKLGRGSKGYSSRRSRQHFNSESSTGSESHQADLTVAKVAEVAINDDDIREVDDKLDQLHIKHAYKDTKSLCDSRSHANSVKESSAKKSGRRTRHRYEDVEEAHSNRLPSERMLSRTESEKNYDDKIRNSKQFVKFSKEIHERKHLSHDTGSDSDSSSRPRSNDYTSRIGRRDRENTRHQKDKRQEDDNSEQHAKGGGLLRLPERIQLGSEPRTIPPRTDVQSDHSAYLPYYDKHYPSQSQSPSDITNNPHPARRHEDRQKQDGRSRGAADRSRLWDPNKPQQRPALVDKQCEKDELHFYDPEEEQRCVDGVSPSEQRNLHPNYQYPPGYCQGSYHPGYPQVPQSFFPQGYYTSQPQPNLSSSWAEQVESATHGIPITPPPAAYPGPSYGQFPPLSAAVVASDPYQVVPSAENQGTSHQSVQQQSAMRLLREASGMEIELANVLSRGLKGNDCIDRAISIQHDLEKVCEKMLLLDLDACNKYNVEQLLWKSAYYQLIEALRKQQDPIGVNKDYLMDLLHHGNKFYKGILSKLESGYKFSLEHYTGMDPLRDEKRRSVKLALLSAQRCMIALGDIARYKELANDTSNYGQARSWYLKAQQLVPRNGRPYNQLAILALYTRRKLDAVYYYMRSLAASNQFLTARESLMSLFEEVRKKSQQKEKEELRIKWEKEEAKAEARRNKAKKFLRGDDEQWRQEVWVSHDGVRSDGQGGLREDEEEEEEEESKLKKMSPVEVNKKFVLSFLNAHGKLFTNIGMEAFPHVVDKLLREFSVLLEHSPTPISSTRLLQLMAINMYAAHHTSRQEHEAENMRPLQQEQAVQLGLDMFGLLVARCTTLFKDHITQHPTQTHLLNEDLHEFLPGIKVYADWMMCHMALWNPPPNCTETPYSAAVDVWKVLAQFFNVMDNINTSAVSFIQHQPEDCLEIRLPEDLALSGFVPLMTLPLQPVYVPMGTDKIVAMDCTRINSLRFFAEFLCGLEMPLLAYRKSKGGFFSVAPEYLHADPEADMVEQLDEDDDVIIEDYTEEEEEGESTEADRDIHRLRERKEDLEKRIKQQQRKKAQREAVVDSHRHQRKMEIEIHPVYLVADTNCFIDHQITIQMLVSCKRYTLIVPIVVINELDGLAKGSREGQYNDPIHAYQVKKCASLAMQYLEDQFDHGNKHVRALTGKGTVMDTITFRSEESGNKGNNDDLILKCCLHYCEDKARDFMPHDKDAPVHLLREVVLLTNDRNLRVKALNQNVPVRDVLSFAKWAKV